MWRTGRSKRSRWLSTGRRASSTTRSQLRVTTTSRSLSCTLPRSLLGEFQLSINNLLVLQQSIYSTRVNQPTFFLLLFQWCQSPLCWKPCSSSSGCHYWHGCPAAVSFLRIDYHENHKILLTSLPLQFSYCLVMQAWSRTGSCCSPATARWRRRPDRVEVASHRCPFGHVQCHKQTYVL